MGRAQLGQTLAAEQVAAIVVFLKTLTASPASPGGQQK
jgi:hypothetical protein